MLRKFSFWLLILCMCICALVAQKIEREIIPAYPRHFDQSGYLYQTYLLYGDSIKNGVFASLGRQLFEHTPNGILLVPQGALAMHFLGPTRFSCLAVNIAYYCAALILLSWSVRRRYGFAAALVAIGLFLAAYSPFYVGGMLDFRRDFLTECLFFCVYAFWLSSESLLRRRETLWLTFSVGVLIANRFITATYIAGIFFVLGIALALLGMHCRRKKDLAELPCIRQRIVNYLLACITIGVIGSSIIIYNYKTIFAYYGIGHVLGSEKYIRSAEMHIATRMDSLSFYPKSLLQDHLGGAFLLIGAVALGAVFVSRVLQKKVVGKSNSLDATLNTVFVVAGFVVPLAILTSDISKSPVVGGILVPAVVVGAALLFAWSSKRDSRWTTGIACVVLFGGCGAFLSRLLNKPPILAVDAKFD